LAGRRNILAKIIQNNVPLTIGSHYKSLNRFEGTIEQAYVYENAMDEQC
jgi:hypothetical protein